MRGDATAYVLRRELDELVIDRLSPGGAVERLSPWTAGDWLAAPAFEWGYQGAGPALAAAVVLEDLAGHDVAYQWYAPFMRDHVARLDPDRPVQRIDASEILRWLASHGAEVTAGGAP